MANNCREDGTRVCADGGAVKVLFVTPFFHPVKGGVESHVWEVAKGLVKKGHEVEVWTSDSLREGKIAKKEEYLGKICVRRFRTLFRLGKFSPVFPGVLRAIRKSDADVVHVHVYRHPTNMLAFWTKKPTVLTPHWPDYPRGLRNGMINAWIPVFDKTIGKFLLRRFDKVCIVAGPEKEWLIRKFGVASKKIVLTPNGIPKEYLQKIAQKEARRRLKRDVNERIVLSVGRLHASKGFHRIVEVAGVFPDVKFMILGPDGGEREKLEALCVKQGITNVFFRGEVSEQEKRLWYAAADVFVHPSEYEAFGITVLEAMAHSLPVIVSNRGGLPWVVQGAGLIFEDQNDLQSKLRMLLANASVRKKWGIQAFKKARKFTWDVTVERLDALYRELV